MLSLENRKYEAYKGRQTCHLILLFRSNSKPPEIFNSQYRFNHSVRVVGEKFKTFISAHKKKAKKSGYKRPPRETPIALLAYIGPTFPS
jgi:hypothetical protein